jgi:hypothetical protein
MIYTSMEMRVIPSVLFVSLAFFPSQVSQKPDIQHEVSVALKQARPPSR